MRELSIRINPEVRERELLITIPDFLMPTRSRPTLVVHRFDCSWAMAQYLRKFPADEQAADILLKALQRDPTYDAAALTLGHG